MYAVSGGDVAGQSQVYGYSINPATRALTPLPKSPYPGSPRGTGEAVAIDPTNRFAYLTNSGTNNVSGFAIDASTGDLIPLPIPTYTAGSGPHGTGISLSGKYLYVNNTFDNTISGYHIDANSGKLTQLSASPFPAGPYPSNDVAFTPDGRFFYVPNSNYGGPGSVSAFSVASQTGLLTKLSGSPFPAGTNEQQVAVDPSGQFLYVSDGGASATNTYGFRIDSSTGNPTPLPGSPFATGEGRGLAIDPKGRFLFTENENTDALSSFLIDQSTGQLLQVGAPYAIAHGGSAGIIVDPTGNFVYVGSFAVPGIYGFRINQTTGALTVIPGSPFPSGLVPVSFAIATLKGTSGLSVEFVQPAKGGNAGTVTMQIVGSGFQSGATVKLTGFGSDIDGSNTTVLDPSVLATSFDLVGVSPGIRDVVVTNRDGTSITAEAAFTIESGGAPDVSVSIIGPNKIRVGFNQSFYASFTNSGSIDSGPRLFWLNLPADDDSSQIPAADSPTGNASSVGFVYAMNVGSIPSSVVGRSQLIPIVLPSLAARSSYTLQFKRKRSKKTLSKMCLAASRKITDLCDEWDRNWASVAALLASKHPASASSTPV